MIIAHLIRTHHTDCTEGILVLMEDSRLLYACNVLELPWRENRRQLSCIPDGKYTVVPNLSAKFGQCFKVENVNGREAILINAGNTTADTKGCLLPGTYDKPGRVISSRTALAKLREYAPKGFELNIYEA